MSSADERKALREAKARETAQHYARLSVVPDPEQKKTVEARIAELYALQEERDRLDYEREAWNDRLIDACVRASAAGLSDSDIGDAIGRTRQQVWNIRQLAGQRSDHKKLDEIGAPE